MKKRLIILLNTLFLFSLFFTACKPQESASQSSSTPAPPSTSSAPPTSLSEGNNENSSTKPPASYPSNYDDMEPYFEEVKTETETVLKSFSSFVSPKEIFPDFDMNVQKFSLLIDGIDLKTSSSIEIKAELLPIIGTLLQDVSHPLYQINFKVYNGSSEIGIFSYNAETSALYALQDGTLIPL